MKRAVLLISLLMLFAMQLSGCTLVNSSIAALKSTADFASVEAERRVFAEPGAGDGNRAQAASGRRRRRRLAASDRRRRRQRRPG